MRIIAGAVAVPVIGLPAVAEPVLKLWPTQQEIVKMCNTIDFRYYICFTGQMIRYDPTWPEASFVVWSHVQDEWGTVPTGAFPHNPQQGPYPPRQSTNGSSLIPRGGSHHFRPLESKQ